MHPRSQGTRVEAQDRCGPVLSLNAPSGFRKGLKDLVSLRLFYRKGPVQCKTPFRTLNPMPLLHDYFKENPHVCLCCCRVNLFRRRFIDCRVCLPISDCGKPVRRNDPFVNEVCFDGIRSSFTQLLVVGFSAGSRGIPCNTDLSFRVFFQTLDMPFQDRLRFCFKGRPSMPKERGVVEG